VNRRGEIHKQHSLQNWSPVIDFDVGRLPGEDRDTIYACCGARSSGTIRAFKHGMTLTVYTRSDIELQG
jgi:hypothetical protein